jgi:hypothetical protein
MVTDLVKSKIEEIPLKEITKLHRTGEKNHLSEICLIDKKDQGHPRKIQEKGHLPLKLI